MATNDIVTGIQHFISDLEKEYWEATKRKAVNREEYEKIMKSKTASKNDKLIANLICSLDSQDLINTSANLVILYSLKANAILTNGLEKSLNTLEKQLFESKFLEKCQDIEDIKKLKSLLKAQLEERQRIMEEAKKVLEESRKKDLSYVD